jgi:hypothetical protein
MNLDFDLLIEHAAKGYRAKVLDSPTGQATADFTLPFSSQEMEIFLLRLTRSLGEARRRVRRLESQERELVKEFGGRLFEAVFSGAVLGALQSSLNEAYRKDAGLRVRLRLADTPELADVPWEFLFNPVANRFLNLAPETPLIRYLDLPMPVRPLAVTPPLRVLVMISSPTDFPQLDVGIEWDRLNAALGGLVKRGLVTITRLPNASLGGLQHPLRLDQYHIFHFIGHGGFDESSQDGALALEDAHGRARLVTGQDLGVMLSSHRSLRLIVLNACEGARAGSSDPFGGVAQSLVQQGIPAVIAMQFEITDEAAITFAEELYAAIADGYSVDAALGESRRAIFASGNDVEWATPVLYTRSPNGQLFKMTKRSMEAEGLAKEQVGREEAERLAKEQVGRLAKEQVGREEQLAEAGPPQAPVAQGPLGSEAPTEEATPLQGARSGARKLLQHPLRILAMAVATILLVSVVLVFSSSGNTPTKDEFIQQWDVICAAEQPKIDAVLTSIPGEATENDLPQIAQDLNVVVRFAQGEVTELRGVEPPQADQAIIDSILNDFDRSIQSAEEAQQAAASGDLDGYNSAGRESTQTSNGVNKALQVFGFKECGK